MLEGVNYKFKFVIRDEDRCKYVLYINRKKGEAHLGYLKTDENEDITTKMMVDIDSDLYNRFFETVLPILDKWRKVYTGNINKNKWSVVLNEGGKETKFKGNGDFPKNWDQLIDLITEYEMIFKNDGKEYTEEITETVETNKELSLEYTVAGLGKFEKCILSGLKEKNEFDFGNMNDNANVRILKIADDYATFEFAKDLELGSPAKDESDYQEKDDSYIVSLPINEELRFDSFIPLYTHTIMITGIFDVVKNYYE